MQLQQDRAHSPLGQTQKASSRLRLHQHNVASPLQQVSAYGRALGHGKDASFGVTRARQSQGKRQQADIDSLACRWWRIKKCESNRKLLVHLKVANSGDGAPDPRGPPPWDALIVQGSLGSASFVCC